MHSIENQVAHAEQQLNPIDWVPLASTFSGLLRILAGAVEVAAGIVFPLLKILHILLTNRGSYCDAIPKGCLYSIHGVANIARGVIALIPGVNLLLFIHDKHLGRMNYPEETMRPGVYPLMTAYKLVQYY